MLKAVNLKPSEDFKKWHETIHPEKCKCGSEIIERNQGINGVDVCEKCFYEATKHLRFK